jgi:hypothetical protein
VVARKQFGRHVGGPGFLWFGRQHGTLGRRDEGKDYPQKFQFHPFSLKLSCRICFYHTLRESMMTGM